MATRSERRRKAIQNAANRELTELREIANRYKSQVVGLQDEVVDLQRDNQRLLDELNSANETATNLRDHMLKARSLILKAIGEV